MEGLLDRIRPPASSQAHVLDIGSLDVNGTYRALVEGRGWRYTGVDLAAGANVDLVADACSLAELGDDTADLVISGQALEHMEFPLLAVMAMKRVVRPGGWVMLVAPNRWCEHRHPLDCYRFLPDGMRFLLGGLSGVDAGMRGDDTWGIGQKPVGYQERWTVIDHRADGRHLGRRLPPHGQRVG